MDALFGEEAKSACAGLGKGGQSPETVLTGPQQYPGVERVGSKPVTSAPPRTHSGAKVSDGDTTLAQRGYLSESSKSRFRMPNPVLPFLLFKWSCSGYPTYEVSFKRTFT